MRFSIIYISVLIFLFSKDKAYSQADICMATRWYNRANFNPASIARTDYIYFFSNYRQQWLNINGAPVVFNIQASEYIHKLHSAFGVSYVNDRIGITTSNNPMFSYAYRISNNHDWSFSMGLSAGIFTRTIDGTLFDAENNEDVSLNYSNEKYIRPDAGVGFEFQNNHFIYGISTTHLLTLFKESDIQIYSNHRYGYFVYKSNTPELFNYSIGLQAVNSDYNTVVEGNISFRFKKETGLLKGAKEILDIGLTYNSTQKLIVLTAVNVLPDLKIGYAYEQSFQSAFFQNSTHEIMIEYRIRSIASTTKYRCGNDIFWYR